MEMKQGSAVRFSGTFFSHLVTRVMRARLGHGTHDIDTIQLDGMTVQGFPRPGRVNVVFTLHGRPHYRTYAQRDLVVVP